MAPACPCPETFRAGNPLRTIADQGQSPGPSVTAPVSDPSSQQMCHQSGNGIQNHLLVFFWIPPFRKFW